MNIYSEDQLISFKIENSNENHKFKIVDVDSNKLIGMIVENYVPEKKETHYKLYDKINKYECIGFLDRWVDTADNELYPFLVHVEMNIYDSANHFLGMIEGSVLSNMYLRSETGQSRFQFNLYNNLYVHVGIGCLDTRNDIFTIFYPNDETHLLAKFKWNFEDFYEHWDYRVITDDWDIEIYDSEIIDLRVMKVLAGFAQDTHMLPCSPIYLQ